MDGLGSGYEAFMDGLQSELTGANGGRKSSTALDGGASDNVGANHRPLIPHSQHSVSRYTTHPPASNPFASKREASPTVSDSSPRTAGSHTKDVIMHETMASPGPPPRIPSPASSFTADVTHMLDAPRRPKGHRRAQSEIAFVPDDDASFEADNGSHSPEAPTLSDEVGEDLFNMYIDMEKTVNHEQLPNNLPVASSPPELSCIPHPSSHHLRSLSVDDVFGQLNKEVAAGKSSSLDRRVRHHHSNSMDSFKHDMLAAEFEGTDSKKALAASKLAELALLDPKKVKRILANRQSAARSKERKTRYISELERKVQILQTEATALSAQLTMMQRDTSGLTTENNEFKLRLQAMEQQAQLRDALNEALKEEVQRLRVATGQLPNTTVMGNQRLPQFLQYTHPTHPSNLLTTQQLQSFQQAQALFNCQQRTSQPQAQTDCVHHTSFESLPGLHGGLGGSVKSESSKASRNQESNGSFRNSLQS